MDSREFSVEICVMESSADCAATAEPCAATVESRTGRGVSRTGDAAFIDFYRREHAGQVRRAALLVGSDEAANDIVHDAFTAMYRRWTTITDPGPYLNRAVLNGCRDVGRRRKADRRLVRRLGPADQSRGHQEILLDVVDRLPFNQRAAIVLRFYVGMREREIAAALDCPVGSVGPWISRALATMHKELS